MAIQARVENQIQQQGGETLLAEARELFVAHVAAHSPDKPETQWRYGRVLEHFERALAGYLDRRRPERRASLCDRRASFGRAGPRRDSLEYAD